MLGSKPLLRKRKDRQYASNPYEVPCCQETSVPYERILAFFRVESLAQFSSGHVFWLDFSRLAQRLCGCTKHLLRVYRHGDGDCREPSNGFLRPRNLSVPSCRPTHRRGYTSPCASELQVRVRGSTQ
jgi:hypothetical protein